MTGRPPAGSLSVVSGSYSDSDSNNSNHKNNKSSNNSHSDRYDRSGASVLAAPPPRHPSLLADMTAFEADEAQAAASKEGQLDGERQSPPSSTATSDDEELLPITKRQQILVLACAFMVIFLTIGFNQSYGVFQDYYTSAEQTIVPQSESSNHALVAFIGTLGAGLTWGGSIYVNPIMARLRHPYYIVLAGTLLMSLGFGLASIASHTWELLLTQGLLYGIGSSMVYFPPVGVAPEYFGKHRGAALGFVLSAAGIGGLVLSPVTRTLLSAIGVRWTLRFLCLLNLVVGIPVAFLCPGSRAVKRRPTFVNARTARTPVFILSILGAFLQSGGYFVPLTFFSTFSLSLGYTASFSAVLLGISNGVNAVSRIAMGFAADTVGRQNTLIFCCVGSALCVVVLWTIAAELSSKGAWLAFVILYGMLSGGYAALLPTTIAEIFGVHTYPSINGLLYFVRGCGVFFGSPVGGLILGDTPQDLSSSGAQARTRDQFKDVIWYTTGLLGACSVCVVLVRVFQAHDKGTWNWKA